MKQAPIVGHLTGKNKDALGRLWLVCWKPKKNSNNA